MAEFVRSQIPSETFLDHAPSSTELQSLVEAARTAGYPWTDSQLYGAWNNERGRLKRQPASPTAPNTDVGTAASEMPNRPLRRFGMGEVGEWMEKHVTQEELDQDWSQERLAALVQVAAQEGYDTDTSQLSGGLANLVRKRRQALAKPETAEEILMATEALLETMAGNFDDLQRYTRNLITIVRQTNDENQRLRGIEAAYQEIVGITKKKLPAPVSNGAPPRELSPEAQAFLNTQ